MEGMVGAAYVHLRDGVEIRTKRMRLEPHCTVFQAELFAILQAMEYILRGSAKVAGILSDSSSSLQSVCNPRNLHPLAFAIRKRVAKLREEGREIRLFWVKAHIGLPGNERADELAKQAAAATRVAAQYGRYPVAELKQRLRANSVQKWNVRYQESQTASVTKIFFPDVPSAYATVRKLGLTPLLAQVLTGHGGFSGYLCKFRCKDDPNCVCGSGAEETVQHLIVDCNIHNSDRNDLETVTGIKVSIDTLKELISHRKHRPRLKEFLTKIATDAMRRNSTRDIRRYIKD